MLFFLFLVAIVLVNYLIGSTLTFVIMAIFLWRFSSRLFKCEEALRELKEGIANKSVNTNTPPPEPIKQEPEPIKQEAPSIVNTPLPLSSRMAVAKVTTKIPEVAAMAVQSRSIEESPPSFEEMNPLSQDPPPKESAVVPDNDAFSRFLNAIKDNWVGIFGSIAIVIGAILFGATTEIFHRPEGRVSAMILASLLFLGINVKLRGHPEWTLLRGWLKSIAGAVILFSTLGAGSIPGLQFIHSPLYAFAFLSIGIGANILIATLTASQGVASFHVILSLMALCFAPQTVILLPLGTVIALIGLRNAYRDKWDFHLIAIAIAFAYQHSAWTMRLSSQLLPWEHFLAIGCSLAIGGVAAAIHYTKRYRSLQFEALPFFAHIINWGLLAYNIWLHSELREWTPILFAGLAASGFMLARLAKKREILWLYRTDTLLSLLCGIFAIVNLYYFDIHAVDIALLTAIGTILFTVVAQYEKENFLIKAGFLVQLIAGVIMFIVDLKAFNMDSIDHFSVILRMWFSVALYWGYYIFSTKKKFITDDLRLLSYNVTMPQHLLSYSSILGTVFLLTLYLYYFLVSHIPTPNNFFEQCYVYLSLIALCLWRKKQEDFSTNFSFGLSLITLHLVNFFFLLFCMIVGSADVSLFMGLLLFDIALIAMNFTEFKNSKTDISHLLVYAIGTYGTMLTLAYFSWTGSLIPGALFLGYSLFCHEGEWVWPKLFKRSAEATAKIQNSFVHVGYLFILAFLYEFCTVYTQTQPLWHNISIRLVVEALALMTFAYWMAFPPASRNKGSWADLAIHSLTEITLAFITLSVFLEVAEILRPLMWMAVSLGLLWGVLKNNWPPRVLGYSWLYFIGSIVHTTFVTNTLTMPALSWAEKFHFFTFAALAFQSAYFYIIYMERDKLSEKMSTNRFSRLIAQHLPLAVLLPIFVGAALFLSFNFEKVFLTTLWVGLIFIYFSIGLLIRSPKTVQIGIAALALCSARLIFFDLVQTNLSARALAFICVGALMLLISAVYKKYKHRVLIHE